MNLPPDFLTRTRRLLGEEPFRDFCKALDEAAPVSIRMNRAKCGAVPAGARAVPWNAAGWYLDARPAFTFDPLFHAGCYYVQEASSMFVGEVLRQYVHEPVVMLDLCAAPGGKSTLARSVLPEGSLLVANEVMRNRSQVLAENMVKWGDPSVVVTNNDPADFAPLEAVFDVILADVPCSGEGMFRKDPSAVDEWSVDNVALCWQRQRRILRDIWGCLKPGGLLVYSTCTYNREENEDNVAWIASELGAEVLPVSADASWGITGNLAGSGFPVCRFLPHRTEGEGLFVALLRKDGEEDAQPPVMGAGRKAKKKPSKGGKPSVSCPEEVKAWVRESVSYDWIAEKDRVVAFPALHRSLYDVLGNTLRVLSAGVAVASLKGKDFIPAHALAMSCAADMSRFPRVELEYAQAVAYLRKEAVGLDAGVPRGYVLATYREVPLGFLKNVGNRANNLYPQEWRIRSGYLPDHAVCLFG